MTRQRLAWTGLGILVLGVVSCTVLSPRVRLSPMLPGAIAVATYDADPGPGVRLLCTLGRALDPVVGRLAGDPARAPHTTWLETADGREIHVLWPRHFTARFAGRVELIDRNNEVVAVEGQAIDINLSWDAAAGTVDDPYEVWWVNSDCYAPIH
jgi:hypothetical protein